ncbi:hypothetical protein NHX12_020344 [Muraenolepis orangiensis]|uniref:Zinc finger CCHC-type and RNA-binding motif-containing protein 1 n=1 Tax=Muraenolepis orangiensis TaxID=630683 RepID=A0A9Q0ER86_9TELE|nr:hypothetical protein NHX12_020344 [Muraenolepis orangiensis]
MSGGLAPSKSTVYVSNLPFSLTNNDLHKLFTKYGKVVKVTIVKDKETRQSKGVAFVLFLDKDSAQSCARALNNKQLFGRTVKASIAVDNGRTTEFIRRRNYQDKTKCYECGVSPSVFSVYCKTFIYIEEEEEESEEEGGEDPALDSLSQAIAFQQARMDSEEQRRRNRAAAALNDDGSQASTSDPSKKPKIKKSAYFSDEEELSD